MHQVEVFIRTLRRWASRTYWMIRLLGFSEAAGSPSGKGLVLIQIDGLSHRLLEEELSRGSLPFLSKLLNREHYQTWRHYSGVPSNTPCVQGEIFYGIKQCVPAFQYRDKQTGKIFTMYDASSASQVEERLKRQGEGLLKGGSAYANIFTGDADESHFCASSGWQGALKAVNLYSWLVILILHIDIVFKVLILMTVETVLALSDFFRGLIRGFEAIEELKFIPTRVAVSIVMREIITTYAKIDIARGLPIIHLNYFGYDEQAHRRGPYSGFARWSLQGIDRSVQKIWQACHQATRCHYDLWVYSDHGQEKSIPFISEYGKKFKDAVKELCRKTGIEIDGDVNASELSNESYMRYPRFLGRDYRKLFQQNPKNRVFLTAVGPVAHIYFSSPLRPDQKKEFMRGLAEDLKVPLVLSAEEDSAVLCSAPGTEYKFPRDIPKILGGHPYLNEVTNDLINLCAHPDRGDFILFSWHSGAKYLSFPIEHGAHGGFGPEETNGFAILPRDAPLISPHEKKFLHPYDLREAALLFLERAATKTIYPAPLLKGDPTRLKVMTYNVHSCVGMDGKKSPERIARVIARQSPDLIALQELDEGSVRQAETIARKLRMNFNFHPVINIEKREFGNAILSAYPMRLIKAEQLPAKRRASVLYEPRGAILVEIEFNHQKVLVLNTHLSLWGAERKLQIDSLLGPEWLGSEAYRDLPIIFCGDFNATEQSQMFKQVVAKFQDAQKECVKNLRQKTWSGRLLLRCIDHIFLSPDIQIAACHVPGSELEKVSSDHLPFVTEINIPDLSNP